MRYALLLKIIDKLNFSAKKKISNFHNSSFCSLVIEMKHDFCWNTYVGFPFCTLKYLAPIWFSTALKALLLSKYII